MILVGVVGFPIQNLAVALFFSLGASPQGVGDHSEAGSGGGVPSRVKKGYVFFEPPPPTVPLSIPTRAPCAKRGTEPHSQFMCGVSNDVNLRESRRRRRDMHPKIASRARFLAGGIVTISIEIFACSGDPET